MDKDLFNYDALLLSEQDKSSGYKEELLKAKELAEKGEYDKSLGIYEAILDEDVHNQAAYVGLLRVHSKNFTIFEGKDIDRDIRVIEKLFGDCKDPEYISFINNKNNPEPVKKAEPEQVKVIEPEAIKKPEPEVVVKPPKAPLPFRIPNIGPFSCFTQQALDEGLLEDYDRLVQKYGQEMMDRVINTLVDLMDFKEVTDASIDYILDVMSFGILKAYAAFEITKENYKNITPLRRARACDIIATDFNNSLLGGFYSLAMKNGISISMLNEIGKEYVSLGLSYIKMAKFVGEDVDVILDIENDLNMKLTTLI